MVGQERVADERLVAVAVCKRGQCFRCAEGDGAAGPGERQGFGNFPVPGRREGTTPQDESPPIPVVDGG